MIPSLREDQCTVASCLGGHKAAVYLETLYHLDCPTSSRITSHSTPCIPTSTRALIPGQGKHRTCWQPKPPRSHGDGAQGHSVGLDDLDLQGQTKRPIQSRGARSGGRQSVLLDTGPEYTRKKRKKIGSVQRLIASNQPSDINTSCHLEETRRTKRELVRVGWDQ